MANDQAAGTERSELASRRLPEGRSLREAGAEATMHVLLAEGCAGGPDEAAAHAGGLRAATFHLGQNADDLLNTESGSLHVVLWVEVCH